MSHPSLRLAAARFVLELATTAELIDAAHEALNDSVYSYSLGELATLREPTMADAQPLFVASLRELDIPMPTLDEALDTVMCGLIGAIAEGAVRLETGLQSLHAISFDISHPTRPNPYSRDPKPSPEMVQQL